MSGGGSETSVGGEAAAGSGDKKRDSLGAAGSPAHLIIKDLGEIHSRLLDHRPVVQGETRYFVKEFEEKRGLREMRVLENLRNMIHETNEHTLPKCRETMQDNLNQVLQRLQAATDSVCRLQEREQERKKISERKVVLGLEQASSPCISSRIPADTHHVFKVEVLCGPSGFLLSRPSPVFGPPVTMQLPGGTWFLWPVFSFQYAAAFAGNTR
uniref:Biogenesis of lysosome-related organelles complex 1 subunit 5 n=1 Tax=Rhinolophus ferrumequinum TaxID=59479 RepID=A0A671FV26_RHIFE